MRKLVKTLRDTTLALLCVMLLIACESKQATEVDVEVGKASVVLMTFNVENLFDNQDDPGKDDKAYLALAAKQTDAHKAECAEITVDRWRDQCLNWDWHDEIIEKKLQVIARTILQIGNGRGPDVLALQEIENVAILERLRIEYLGAADYGPSVLLEGDDSRGVDVAFLSRLELVNEPVLHRIRFADFDESRVADTRGILQADFRLPDGSTLTGFAVHFPAPYHPTEMREAAYEHLNRLRANLPADRSVFAAGDFNTTSTEDAEKDMLGRFARPHWTVVHELGCADCLGTQYYAAADNWSFLDMILWSTGDTRGKKTTWNIRANSVEIANKVDQQVRQDGTPARFQLPDGSGVSDHWPLIVSLESK